MKKGWQTKTLGDVIHLVSGQHIEAKDYNTESQGVGYLTGPSDFGFINPTVSKWTEFPKVMAKRGDILLTVKGSGVGKINLLDQEEVAISRQLMAVRVIGADPRFIYVFLSSTLSHFQSESTGAAIPGISREQVLGLKIPLPPFPEQKRIVGILDKAFEGIAAAKANAEKNLQNARALFESHLQSVFTQRGEAEHDGETDFKLPVHSMLKYEYPSPAIDAEMTRLNNGQVTKTGGREATLRHIPGKLSLAVGMPRTVARKGWSWTALTDLARLESGHTPSRRHPEYWGGSVAWIGIQDARENHGRRIIDTFQKTNELGIANSSARILPENTVCLSRTASVGYVVVMGRPMATSQDFVNWVCSDKLKPDFLKYLILAEGRDGLLRYASGSVHQTIYFPEAKAFHICYPEPMEQLRIVRQCDALRSKTQRLASLYQRKLAALEALKKSLLHQAFTGQL